MLLQPENCTFVDFHFGVIKFHFGTLQLFDVHVLNACYTNSHKFASLAPTKLNFLKEQQKNVQLMRKVPRFMHSHSHNS